MLKAKRIFVSARLLNSRERKKKRPGWSGPRGGRGAGNGDALAGLVLPPKTPENGPGEAVPGNH